MVRIPFIPIVRFSVVVLVVLLTVGAAGCLFRREPAPPLPQSVVAPDSRPRRMSELCWQAYLADLKECEKQYRARKIKGDPMEREATQKASQSMLRACCEQAERTAEHCSEPALPPPINGETASDLRP